MARAAYLTEWMAWALMVVTDSFDQPGGMWFNPGYHVRLDRRRRLRALPMEQGAPSRPDIPSFLGEWPSALIPAEIEAGRLRALLVVGGNPATALPDGDRLQRALSQLDVLLVADITTTATTQLATHAFGCAGQLERPDLPALDMFSWQLATHWTDAVVEPRPERPEMWRLLAGLAERLGHPVLEPSESIATFPTETLVRRARPTVDIDALRAAHGVLVEAPTVHGWVQDHLPLERWQLAPALLVEQLRPNATQPPLVLAPRRQSRRMNGLAYREGDRPEAVIHPLDAGPQGILDGDLVEVTSATGAVRLRAKVTDSIAAGTVSIPHGWPEANVNVLVSGDDIDPLTGMPVQSGTALQIRPVPA
jgi:anaerobic selenocysteine-containing dehydrogenase